MSSFRSRKAAAGLASGFLSMTALFSVVVALMIGLGLTGTASKEAPPLRIGVRR